MSDNAGIAKHRHAVRRQCHWRESSMTLMRWSVAAALLLAVGAGGADAATDANFTVKTTGDVVALCDPQGNGPIDNAGINFCDGFAQGVVLTEQEHEAGRGGRKLFCLPDPPPTRNEAIADFVKWARASPDRLNITPVDGLITYLGDRYPCPKHR
jgi:hypothetical protein